MTIKSILVYTSEGSVLYKWENHLETIGNTHTILVPGFFSALSSVLGTIFQDRLQQLILENNTIVLTGKEIKIDSNIKNKTKLIIISALVDTEDNTDLIDKIISKIFHILEENLFLEEDKLIQNDELDSIISNLVNSRVYERNSQKIMISAILVFFGIFISSFVFLINYSFIAGPSNSRIIAYLIGIHLAALLVIPAASFAGNKSNSGISGLIGASLGSMSAFITFEYIITELPFLEGFGTPIVFFTLSILLGLLYGTVGGYFMEKRYLYG